MIMINPFAESKIKGNIVKYHSSLPNFDTDGISSIKIFLNKFLHEEIAEPHFLQRLQEKKMVRLPVKYILAKGKCFEYKLLQNKFLYRIALRIEGNHERDFIYILEPHFEAEKGFVRVKYITAYSNNKDDIHLSLNSSLYFNQKK